jgi:ribosomal protein L18
VAGEEDILKKGGIIVFILLLAITLGACSSSSTDQLPTTIRTEDKRVSVRVPEGWTQYEAEAKDNLVLVIQDSASAAYAQIFRFTDVGDVTVKDYVSEAANYYGSSVTGSADDVTIDGKTGYYFAYKAAQTDEDGNTTYTCQGYEYFVPFGKDIVEVDIFYRFTDDEPTIDELAVLRSIAESLRVKS